METECHLNKLITYRKWLFKKQNIEFEAPVKESWVILGHPQC